MGKFDQIGSVESARGFRTTQWTVLLQAKADDSQEAAEGVSQICRSYWPPIYAYLRRVGHHRADAEDLVQGFFQHLLRQDWLAHVEPERGKFRSFLLKCLKNFCANAHARSQTEKRGGKHVFIPYEEVIHEEEHAFRAPGSLSPDEIFERRWAEAVMQQSLARLEQEYVAAGKAELFRELKELQPGEGRSNGANYGVIGARFGLSEGAIKSAVHRMRLRHRNILRGEIAATLSNPIDVDEELRHLLQALTR